MASTNPTDPTTTTNARGPSTPLDADRMPHTESRYTEQQEREMGVRDASGVTIQPTNAFMMVFLMYIGVAAVLVVLAVVAMRFFF